VHKGNFFKCASSECLSNLSTSAEEEKKSNEDS
jgi:hypothetical protein